MTTKTRILDINHKYQGRWQLTFDGMHYAPQYGAWTFNDGQQQDETITYDDGPRRLAGVPNWKNCWHSWYKRCKVGYLSYTRHTTDGRGFEAGTVPIGPGASLGTFGILRNLPTPASPDTDAVMHALYREISGGINDGLLLLEDVAGFVGGGSLWKSITSFASASKRVTTTTAKLRRIAKRFGAKRSLYAIWQSAWQELQALAGLRLAYRFSFKTTLNDILQTCGMVDEFALYAAKLKWRNAESQRRLIRFRQTESDYQIHSKSTLTGSAIHWISGGPTASRPNKLTITGSTQSKATAYAWGQVHYPSDFLGMKHFLERYFGLDKPLTTLWAIVPLSFLIDYLVPVQDFFTVLDNKLNTYNVFADISGAWALPSWESRVDVDVPDQLGYEKGSGWLPSEIRGGHTSLATGAFYRNPASVGSIADGLSSLIVGDVRTIQKLGTGLEIGVQLLNFNHRRP